MIGAGRYDPINGKEPRISLTVGDPVDVVRHARGRVGVRELGVRTECGSESLLVEPPIRRALGMPAFRTKATPEDNVGRTRGDRGIRARRDAAPGKVST